jgi:putative sterol carrier protein
MRRVTSIPDYLDSLGERFVASEATVKAVFQFEFTTGTWHVVVEDGAWTLVEGAHAAPTTTLKMADADYVRMVNGDLKGTMAYMTGKLKVKGSIPMAQRLNKIFPPIGG